MSSNECFDENILTFEEKKVKEKIVGGLISESDNNDINCLFRKCIWDCESVSHLSIKKKSEVLMELFGGKIPNLLLRKRENEKIEKLGINLYRYSQDFCGILLPVEMIDTILSFSFCDKSLLDGFGLASKLSYFSVLLNWSSLSIEQKTDDFSIPLLILRNATTIGFERRTFRYQTTTMGVERIKYLVQQISQRRLNEEIRYRPVKSLIVQNSCETFLDLIGKKSIFSDIKEFEAKKFGIKTSNTLESSKNYQSTILLNDYFPKLEKVNIRFLHPTMNSKNITQLNLFYRDEYYSYMSYRFETPKNLFEDYPYFKNLKKIKFFPKSLLVFQEIGITEKITSLDFCVDKIDGVEKGFVFPFECIRDKKKFSENLEELIIGKKSDLIIDISSRFRYIKLKKLELRCGLTPSTFELIPTFPVLTELSLPNLTNRNSKEMFRRVIKLFTYFVISEKFFRYKKILIDFEIYTSSYSYYNWMSFNFDYLFSSDEDSKKPYFQIKFVMEDGRHEYDGSYHLKYGSDGLKFFDEIFGKYHVPSSIERPIVILFCDISQDDESKKYFENWKSQRKNVVYHEADIYGTIISYSMYSDSDSEYYNTESSNESDS